VRRLPRRRAHGRRRRASGQALTETILMMGFLLLFIFSIVHLSMLAATKYVVNYAAFAAARATMVDPDRAWPAALEAMHNLRWWRDPARNAPDNPVRFEIRYERIGAVVVQRVPFGLPMFNRIPDGGLEVVGFAPAIQQPDVPERGDNCGCD
jgi:hypothetical protein